MTEAKLTAEVVVIKGCSCEERWFNCRCAATEQHYKALPLNWMDSHEPDFVPDEVPSVEAVADILRANPGCTVRYLGGNSRIFGGGMDGYHFELALAKSKEAA